MDREARAGDSVVIDMTATRDGQAVAGMSYTDYSVELGAGNDLPELDEHLPGRQGGRDDQLRRRPGRHPGAGAGRGQAGPGEGPARATDEWASEASEFSTLAELRQDIEKRMSEYKRAQAAMSLRNGTLEALVALVDEEPPEVLVDAEVRRSAEELGRRLDAQGVRLERYLEATGRTPRRADRRASHPGHPRRQGRPGPQSRGRRGRHRAFRVGAGDVHGEAWRPVRASPPLSSRSRSNAQGGVSRYARI